VPQSGRYSQIAYQKYYHPFVVGGIRVIFILRVALRRNRLVWYAGPNHRQSKFWPIAFFKGG
jgi:hypothetical protein